MLKREVTQFCRSTYTHGFKFIIMPDRHIFESFLDTTLKLKKVDISGLGHLMQLLVLYLTRLAWFVATAISILASITLSLLTWDTVMKSPTLTLADTPNYPIWNYLFPAITICNFNTISKARAFELGKRYKKPANMSGEELAWRLRLLHYIIDPSAVDVPHKNFTELQTILNYNDVFVEDLIQYLAPSCKEMMQKCTWKGQQTSCENLFEQTKTVDGFCCSFNYFGLKNHSFGNSTSLHLKAPKKPRRLAATGYNTALEAVINSLPEDYFATPFTSSGHKITVHYPYDFPDGNALNMFQSTEALIFMSVKPTFYRTDTKMDKLDSKERECLFRHEKELIYFTYSYYNCISECRANITIDICGCIPFYYQYKRNDSNHSIRICDLDDVMCLNKNKEKIRSSIPGHISKFLSHSQDWREYTGKCPCLPDCWYSRYAVEGSAGEFSKKYVENKPSLYAGVKLRNQSVFRVFFDDLVATKYTTSMIYYWHTILGLFGGILGLFTGCSIVSIIEAIYFFTIRPILDLLVLYKATNSRRNQRGTLQNVEFIE